MSWQLSKFVILKYILLSHTFSIYPIKYMTNMRQQICFPLCWIMLHKMGKSPWRTRQKAPVAGRGGREASIVYSQVHVLGSASSQPKTAEFPQNHQTLEKTCLILKSDNKDLCHGWASAYGGVILHGPWFKFWLLHFWSKSLLMAWRVAVEDGPRPTEPESTWGSQKILLAPSFRSVQFWPSWSSGEWNSREMPLSFSLSICLSNRNE